MKSQLSNDNSTLILICVSSVFHLWPTSLGIDREVQIFIVSHEKDEAIEHLVVGLRTPRNRTLWIRVVRIERRIVEMRHGFDPRSFREPLLTWRNFISQLPFKVVIRNL